MTLRYVTSFTLSLLLTLVSFGVVWLHDINHHAWPSHNEILIAVIIAALVQLFVQFAYFLEVGRKSGAWRLVSLGLTLVVAAIVFIGSLWIMANLGHASPDQRFDGAPSPQSQID